MPCDERDLQAIVEDTWRAVLNTEAVRLDRTGTTGGAGGAIEGCLFVAGGWHGAVVGRCPRSLAVSLARAGGTEEVLRPAAEDVQDAFGMVMTRIGAGMRRLLPDGCHLGLPAVVDGRDFQLHVRGTHVVFQLVFDIAGETFCLSLLRAAGELAPVTGV